MEALVAAVPVLTVLVLMVGRGWTAASAGAVTAVATVVLAVTVFEFGGTDDPFGVAGGTAGVLAEAAFVTATILAIIGPALGIHHLQERTGATVRLRSALSRLHPDPRVAALLVAWFFALFLEGAAGFGTPVALAAPFLVAAGFPPLTAVAAALVGHAAGVSFGAVGTPVLAQLPLVDVSAREISAATAPYHLALGWILAAVVVAMIGRARPEAGAPWRWGLLAAFAFFVPYGVIAAFVGPELPTLGGALVGMAAFAAVATSRARRLAPATPRADGAEMGLGRAASPYLSLVGLVLVTRLVPPLRDGLQDVVVEWRLTGGFTGSVAPLFHPALLLTAGFVAGAVLQPASARDVWVAFWSATTRLGGVAVALLAMVTIARTMSQGGMTAELAEAAAATGGAWPLIAPSVGALGTFVTGSATASNVLFTDLQASTADEAGLPVLPLIGAQGFGAAVGNIICPHNVVAAVATVGLSGQEGMVLRRTLPTALLYVALGGLLALGFTV